VTVLHIVLALGFAWSMGAAMAGAGFARGRESVHVHTLVGILQGWLLGPAGGLAIAFAAERVAQAMTS